MRDIEKAVRYTLASLPSPKLKRAPIKVASGTYPKLPAPKVWHDEFEKFAGKLAVGFDLGSLPAGVAIHRVTWTPEGPEFTPIAPEEYFADPSNKDDKLS